MPFAFIVCMAFTIIGWSEIHAKASVERVQFGWLLFGIGFPGLLATGRYLGAI